MWLIGISKVGTDPRGKLFGGKQPIMFDHIAFGMDPVEPEQFPLLYRVKDDLFSASLFGYGSDLYEDWLREIGRPERNTRLWIIAWDGEQVVRTRSQYE